MICEPYRAEKITAIVMVFATITAIVFIGIPENKKQKEWEDFAKDHCQITEKFLGNVNRQPTTTYKCDDGVVYVK